MTIKAIIFDFDGLMLDTETPEYDAWRDLCAEYNIDFPLAEYVSVVGSAYDQSSIVAPWDRIVQANGTSLTVEALIEEADSRKMQIIHAAEFLPGVTQAISDARERGLSLALASSSPRSWIDLHLTRRDNYQSNFVTICTRDDVERVKPAPDVFACALDKLGVTGEETIVFEDSMHGVHAAKSLAMNVVAVPNPITTHSDLSAADLQLDSLSDRLLADLITYFESNA